MKEWIHNRRFDWSKRDTRRCYLDPELIPVDGSNAQKFMALVKTKSAESSRAEIEELERKK